MNRTRIGALVVTLLLLAGGCASEVSSDELSSTENALGYAEETSPKSQGTIVDLAVSSPELSTLVEAVLKAGLADALGQEGPFTVFAPTNGAFSAFGIDPEAVDAETLAAVLLNHTVPERLSARKIRYLAHRGEGVETLGGLTLHFGRRPLTVNELPFRFVNRRASNGIVHVIDGVLLEGGPSIVDQVKLRASLSTLLAAVSKAELEDTLAHDGPFTVFAPTNAAFAAFGINPEAVDADTLQTVLLDHVATGQFSRSDLRALAESGGTIETLGGLNLSLDRRGRRVNGLNVVGQVGAINGTIQVINGVLLE